MRSPRVECRRREGQHPEARTIRGRRSRWTRHQGLAPATPIVGDAAMSRVIHAEAAIAPRPGFTRPGFIDNAKVGVLDSQTMKNVIRVATVIAAVLLVTAAI